MVEGDSGVGGESGLAADVIGQRCTALHKNSSGAPKRPEPVIAGSF